MVAEQKQSTSSRTLTAHTAVGPVLAPLFDHLADVIVQASGDQLTKASLQFNVPPTAEQGDYTFRCFGLANLWKKAVDHVATDLVAALQPSEYVEKFSASGPYLNIFLKRDVLVQRVLDAVRTDPDAYGTRQESDDIIVLEYISVNTNKPMHIGHLRNGLIGWSVAELLKSQGAEVVKTDIVNDRGIHIVKAMLAYQKWGNSETPEATHEKGDHFVGRQYVRFDQELKKEEKTYLEKNNVTLSALAEPEQAKVEAAFRAQSALWQEAQTMLQQWEAGDAPVRALWQQMKDWVMTGIEQTYVTFGFDFDHHDYESEIYEKGRAIIDNALADGVFVKADNGAVVVPLSKTTNLPDKVVQRSDGTTLYMTQDLYLAHKRFDEYGFTKSLYVVANEQILYFQQLIETLKLLNFVAADRLVHLSYGYVSLPEGRMKSREGTVVDADDLIAEMKTLARVAVTTRHPELEESVVTARAHSIALAALKFHFLSISHDADMVFDPNESLAFEGRTGPYLQYSYARAASIVRKAEASTDLPETLPKPEPVEWQLTLGLLDFPRVVTEAATQYEPAKVANCLADLAQLFSTFYHELPVLEADQDIRNSRLALIAAYQAVMKNGLALLGIETLEEM